MPQLAGHLLFIFTEQELIKNGHRLAKRSARLVPLAAPDLFEGAEICIKGQWFEIFLADLPRNRYFLEQGEPSG